MDNLDELDISQCFETPLSHSAFWAIGTPQNITETRSPPENSESFKYPVAERALT
jgi:hypothetical protein